MVSVLSQHIGIVVRSSFPEKYKVSVLDGDLGRIVCYVPKKAICSRLCRGDLISYDLDWFKDWRVMHHVDIVRSFSGLGHIDLVFLHSVLELCFYFIPPECKACRAFKLVMHLYDSMDRFLCKNSKKLFLCRLLAILGVYPDDENLLKIDWIRNLLNEPIDSLHNETIDLASGEELIDSWLFSCLGSHPQSMEFKAVGQINSE